MRRLIRLLIFLCVSISLSTPALASRSLKIKTKQGREVGTYKGSYALLIGVSDYTAGWPDLEQIPSELGLVEKVLMAQGFEVKKKINPNADQLEEVIEDFIDQYGYTKGNRLLFYYAGHGHTMNGGRRGYLVPADAPDPRNDPVDFKRKALDMTQILAWCRQMDAKHALFLFDSCFSGTIFKQRDLPEAPPHITRMTTKPVRQFITAGTAGESVPAKSTFTPAFVDAIQYGLGDLNDDGYVSGVELGLYLQGVVPKYCRQSPQYGKIRDYELSRGDFVFQLASSGATVDRPAPSRTTLSVSSNISGAIVYVNGRQVGTTPIEDAKISSGEHTVKVEKPGYEPYRKRMTIDPGRAVTLYADLQEASPRKARLFVDTDPSDASIRILNIGPRFSQGMELDPGRYHMEVTADRHETWKEWITLGAGEDRNLMVRLAPVSVSTGGVGGEQVESFTVNGVSFKMVRIPAGEFMMGSPSNESGRDDDERQHRVRITRSFWMGETEVTQGLWKAVMGSNPSRFNNCGDDCPVEQVSWNDCQQFIRKLNAMVSGGGFRLPTEGEWEYACRAGTTTVYHWGDRAGCDKMMYENDVGSSEDKCVDYVRRKGLTPDSTAPVKSYAPNAWGLYDMHGNVWEWCQGWYGDYSSRTVTDPAGPSGGAYRVIRGGGWSDSARRCRSANRYGFTPGFRFDGLGFRLARN